MPIITIYLFYNDMCCEFDNSKSNINEIEMYGASINDFQQPK